MPFRDKAVESSCLCVGVSLAAAREVRRMGPGNGRSRPAPRARPIALRERRYLISTGSP
jgi:hypothetical protein